MQNMRPSSYLFYSHMPSQFRGEPSSEESSNEEIHPKTRRKYEDFVSKLLDENKKLIDLVEFQKKEIENLHKNYSEWQNLTRTNGPKAYEANGNKILSSNRLDDQKFRGMITELTNENEDLRQEKEKLELINRRHLAQINDLNEENQRLKEVLAEIKEHRTETGKNSEEDPRSKYDRMMDLITEMGEKEKTKEDLIFKVLDLENKVNQLLMENDKLHKYIQEIKK